MAADQAAGLRRRRAAPRPARCIHFVSAQPAAVYRLLEALTRQGLRTLLIDAYGRHADPASRSLFDWRQQLARRQLHIHALPYGEGWHAPGIEAGAPELAVLAAHYDGLVFDRPLEAAGLVASPPAGHTLALDVTQTHLEPAYRLLKTLAHHACAADILLLGEPAACARIEAACRQFLDAAHAQNIGSLACETDAFAALAVRMASEETGPRAVA